jgi:hypothetical protein
MAEGDPQILDARRDRRASGCSHRLHVAAVLQLPSALLQSKGMSVVALAHPRVDAKLDVVPWDDQEGLRRGATPRCRRPGATTPRRAANPLGAHLRQLGEGTMAPSQPTRSPAAHHHTESAPQHLQDETSAAAGTTSHEGRGGLLHSANQGDSRRSQDHASVE